MGGVSIKLKPGHLKEIREHGERTYPFECCGLLLGHRVEGEKVITEIYAAGNAKEEGTQHNRFLIPPAAMFKAEKYARTRSLVILGVYHSHPNAPARPSQFDLDNATPFYSYVIVSVRDGKAADQTCWKLLEDPSRFEPETIAIMDGS
jgi:proteasome lid subunit RPN8/RPN11